MFRKFKSIAHEAEIGYAYDSQAYGSGSSRAAYDCHFRAFQTYNDGLCQHSGDWTVQLEHLTDYLFSLALVMSTDDELAQEMYYKMWRRPSVEQIEFAASVIYKKPKDDNTYLKPRYFSLEEKKITSNPDKRYDKRYEEIREIHDGETNSIFRILTQDWHDGLQKFITADTIREWCMANDRYMDLTAEFLGWFKEDRANGRDRCRLLRDAYEACKNVTEAYRLRENVKSSIENYGRYAEREAERRAEEASAKLAAKAKEVSNA